MLFDETMGGLRSVFDTVGEHASGAFENTRGFVERTKLRGQLNELYRQLGKAEYEAAVNGVSSMDEINMLIQKITELRQQQLSMEQSSQRGGTVTCPTCGKLNSAQDSFCPGCGAQLK